MYFFVFLLAKIILLTYLLKISIFNLYLPHLTKSGFGISEVYVLGIQFQIKFTNIFVTKDWSDQEVNTQFDKDLNP